MDGVAEVDANYWQCSGLGLLCNLNTIFDISLGISNIEMIIQIKQVLWLLCRRIDCNEAKEELTSFKAEFVTTIEGKN